VAQDKNSGRGGGYRATWYSEAAHYPTDGVRDANTMMGGLGLTMTVRQPYNRRYICRLFRFNPGNDSSVL
jgi:hypothetical protein